MQPMRNGTREYSSGQQRICLVLHFAQAAALFMALAALAPAVAASQGPPGPSGSGPQVPLSNPLPHPTSILLPAANRPPDANDIMSMRNQKVKQANFEIANTERKRQLEEDSALLLKLAAELKAEVDKTPSDLLSLSLVRKADDIERLAHIVQAKMKLTVGAE